MAGYSYWGMGSMTDYEIAVAKSREALANDPGLRDLVRFATLAANSHNTQPWKFALADSSINIIPDAERRTPVVDPDDHHLYASLGCAAENLALAASAKGRSASVVFDPSQIRIDLAKASPAENELFGAITKRQCTRSVYSGADVPAGSLKLLEDAARQEGVDFIVITDRVKREQVLEAIIAANSAQLSDSAFVAELKGWIRFNPAAALITGDGLFSACSGNPNLPTWFASVIFPLVLTAASENQKCVEQVRSSAGIAIFASRSDDKEHWFNAGRAYERFALQATAMGIRNAFLNQPVEVPAKRAEFAKLLGLTGGRPDFVVRFGEAPAMPMSLRRPVASVLV